MRYKFILTFLFFVALQLKATALPDLPQGAVPIRLNVEYISPKSATYPIKRQPGAGLFLYLYDRILFVPDIGESYNICLIDTNDVIAYSACILPGQCSTDLPDGLMGDYVIRLVSNNISYAGNLSLI